MRKKHLSKRAKLEAIEGSGGVMTTIAARAGVHRETVANWRDADPDIAEAIEAERESLVDAAEQCLINAVAGGDVAAAKFVCATLGRDRGWTQRTEVAAEVRHFAQVQICLPPNGRDDHPRLPSS